MFRYEIGALYRGQVRANLDRLGLLYTEEKTLVDSVFLVHAQASDTRFRIFHTGMREMVDRFAAQDRATEAREAAFQAAWRWWNPRTWSGIAKGMSLFLSIIILLPLAITLLVTLYAL